MLDSIPNFWGEVVVTANIKFRGLVKDSLTGKPIPGASIKIVNTETVTISNEDGSFELQHTRKLQLMEISCTGYETRRIDVRSFRNSPAEIFLSPHTINLPQVVVTTTCSYRTGRLVMGAYYTISKSEKKELNDQNPISIFKIFLNPAQFNSIMHIEWKTSEEGYYTLQLLSQSGEIVFKKRYTLMKQPVC